MNSRKYLSWLHEIDDESKDGVGRKALRLYELAKAGFTVPRGFVIEKELLTDISNRCFLTEKINHQLNAIDPYNPGDIALASKRIQALVEDIQIPRDFALELYAMYEKLGNNAYVSIRGSVAEGAFSVSHNAPFLGVSGDANILIYIRKMWASYFSPHTIETLLNQKQLQYQFAIIIEELIDSQVSGVLYTSAPEGMSKDTVYINATYGIRDEYLVKYPYPDLYQVSKRDLSIIKIESIAQRRALRRVGSEIVETSIQKEYQDRQKLPNRYITTLAKWSKTIQAMYFFPQKVEWALMGEKLYLLDVEPLLNQEKIDHPEEKIDYSGVHLEALINTQPESLGLVTGPLKRVRGKHVSHIVPGDIVYLENCNQLGTIPLKKIGGLVIEQGNSFDQKILFLKGSGVPFIIGKLHSWYEGVVTLDASKGVLYKGSLPAKFSLDQTETVKERPTEVHSTATKIYLDTSNPADVVDTLELAEGIGLVKSEYLEKMYGNNNTALSQILEIRAGKPVFYRLYDGGEYRGTLSYLLLPKLLTAELEKVVTAFKHGTHKNCAIVIPYVRTADELKNVFKSIIEHQITSNVQLKVWVMIETPSAVIDLENILDQPCEGIVIGLNDLTAGIFSLDRTNPDFKHMYTQVHPLIEKTVKSVVEMASKHKKPVIVAGEALADSYDVLKYCIKSGVQGVCVSKEAVARVRSQIVQIEKEIIS